MSINHKSCLNHVFEVTPKAIHIFYDSSVNSIALNRDGALFFNLKFYLELHEQKCKTKPTIDAMTYWFTIYCHVLAHNFIQLHNSEFEVSINLFKKFFIFLYTMSNAFFISIVLLFVIRKNLYGKFLRKNEKT